MRMEVKATVVMQKHWRSAKALRRAMEGMREKDENGQEDGKAGGGVCRECRLDFMGLNQSVNQAMERAYAAKE